MMVHVCVYCRTMSIHRPTTSLSGFSDFVFPTLHTNIEFVHIHSSPPFPSLGPNLSLSSPAWILQNPVIALSTARFLGALLSRVRTGSGSQPWAEAENTRVFDKCVRPHGHNYVITVSIRGPIDPMSGMVIGSE